ncbi:hypothetical protein [Peribacillus sp. SCS-155]|uniref:hypothetical protein n=1 Tax=Peribacillus sedimenti TaxID=3115297 RepID=UPI003905E187
MKLVSWNCKKGLNSKDKSKKLFELIPDIAIIQESFHPKEFNDDIQYEDAVWVGEEKDKGLGLCVLSLSKDYHLSLLVDKVKHEWIVPIKVSGKENFTLIAVWTKRMHGSSYGKVLFTALQEYERLIQNGSVIIMGDFNLDKRVSSSYTGVGGYTKMMEIFENYGLKSCYHSISREEYGSESQATYYHYGKSDKPFHLDYCFVSQDILPRMNQFYIGTAKEFLPFSDHVPLVFEFTLSFNNIVEKSTAKKIVSKDSITQKSMVEETKFEKTIITPEILLQDYLLKIDGEFTTIEEIEEAVKYIKAQRIMRKL